MNTWQHPNPNPTDGWVPPLDSYPLTRTAHTHTHIPEQHFPTTAAHHDPSYNTARQRWDHQQATDEAGWRDAPDLCLIRGCPNTTTDTQQPIATRDGTLWRACPAHWAAIMRVLRDNPP